MQRDTASDTGYEPRAARNATVNSSNRVDLRWGRLSFAEFRDDDFLAKQLRRIEITHGARRPGGGEGINAVGDKSIRERLMAAQSKAAKASQEEDSDVKEELLADLTVKTEGDSHDIELVNALGVLGDLQQPQLATLMATNLKDALRRACTFPNPVYQLIALRRQLMQNMHEAVAAQHRQRRAVVQGSLAIVKCLESSPEGEPSPREIEGSVTIKAKEKVAREASMGIQVLISFLADLQDMNLTQRREFLADLLPLLSCMGFLSLSPKRGVGTNSSRSSSGGASTGADTAAFTEKTQRFLLAMCPRYTSFPAASPKLPAISSGSGDLEVLDRTNAVNGLLHLAAATGSVRDFLVVLRVLLGTSDCSQEPAPKERSSLSSRSIFTSSVPSLATVRYEGLLPSPLNSGRDDDGMTRQQKGSPLSKRETEILGDNAMQDTLKRKTMPKSIKVITNAGSTTVSFTTSSHHRLLYGSPGNNLVSKQRTKDELRDELLLGNGSLSLDMSKMKESSSRDMPVMMTSRSETPVVTARCPKFKALNIQSVLIELDQAKPSAPTRVSRGKPTSSLHTAHAGFSSDDVSLFAGEDDEGDREVWSCGQNSYGELGHGDTAPRKSFERIESLQQKEIVQIGAGNEHTIALTADGKVLTCGYNDNGQCGQGGTARVSFFSEISKMENGISQVHAYNGCEHTIFVTMDGRATTCGYNYRGQLGHGNTASESVPKIVRSLENRVVRLVSCSYYHTVMACEEDGSGQQFLFTFGRNDYGQLGHNDSIDRKVPQHVEALTDQQIASVACGQYHTMIVTATGKAFAFGKNDYGQLGIDSMENQFVPVQVRSGLEKHECLEIRCGYYHSIVLCSGAHLFAFGRNDYGQLGLGRANASATANLQLQQQRFACAKLIEELEGKDIVRVSCGCYHTIAVSDNGVMYVFGRNNHGQLGTGDTNERVYPFPIDDFAGKRVALVAAGFYHTVVLTGGKDEKNDQEAEKGDAATAAASNDITYSTILSTSAVQELLNPDFVLNDTAETPAIDPIDDDFRDEDNHLSKVPSSKSVGSSSSDSGDALFVAAIILAQLDRLCQPFIAKPGSYPTLHHPTVNVIESLLANTTTPSFDVSGAFEGSFDSFGIHNCSSTFQSLAALMKHLSTKKIETTSQLAARLVTSSTASATPRRQTQPNTANKLQMYLLFACIRVLQANISQLLRSGMAKAVILLSPENNTRTSDVKPWMKELDRMRASLLQVREVLVSLIDIKHRRNSCYEGENAARIAEEATATLMQGFEVFLPCRCLQRQFCMHTMHELPTTETLKQSCGVLCRRELWSFDVLPRSKTLLLEPLLRRIAEDSLIVRFLPLTSSISPQISCVSSVSELYQLLLERIAADSARRLGEAVAVRPSSDTLRQDANLRAFCETLSGFQKHLSSWAASVSEWTMTEDSKLTSNDIETEVAKVVDRIFRVDEVDLDRVPIAWRCYIEFALAVLGQCCEVLGQILSMESIPSPTHGFDHAGLDTKSVHARMLEVVEHSIVGRFLPLLAVSLFEFSNHSLFAAALLPTLKSLLRSLDRFNHHDDTVEAAETLFVESVASSVGPRPQKNEISGSFRRKSDGNLILSREEEGTSTSRKGLTTAEAMALPWHYRLEKELAVLAAEMAITLVIGDPFFTYTQEESEDSSTQTVKLSERWLSSPLFRGGLSSKHLVWSIQQDKNGLGGGSSRVVQHSPFPAALANVPNVDSQPFSLILPSPESKDPISYCELPTEQNYGEMFCPASVSTFLTSLQSADSSTNKLCEWVRDSYAKKDPSYRMIVRQSQLAMNLKPAANPVDKQVHENDIVIETCFFAALLHHNMLGSQAFHFALGMNRVSEPRGPPPRSFLSLWQSVSQLRRRVATKKTEIKNTPSAASESLPMDVLARIVALQQTILNRCKLLLLVAIHEEQEHLNIQLDAGYIPPCDPAFLVSASSAFKLSASSAKKHLHATYTDENLPFLVAFPFSRWKKVRTILHSIIRWKSMTNTTPNTRQNGSGRVSQEVLAYVTSDELVSSSSAIKTLLVDPCRRVSCSVRGVETLWELLTLVSFDSIQADIVHQVAQVFVFQSRSLLTGAHNVGYFYSSLQSETFSEFYGQLTEMMADKAAALMEPSEDDVSSKFWIVIVLLSAWGIHFNTEQFEFVSDIGILNVIQEMLRAFSSTRGGDSSSESSLPTPSLESIMGKSGRQLTLAQLTVENQLGRLGNMLWVLFRYICVHFATQNTCEAETYVPTFPVLSGVADLLLSEAATISNRFLPLPASVNEEQVVESPTVAVRRSFEVITQPHRFSPQSKGLTCTYEDMTGPESSTPMSPLLKPNEFSVTTWLFVNTSQASHPRTVDNDLFHIGQGLHDRQLVFIRGAAREVSLYVVLVPENTDNWQLEVGILMDLNGEFTSKGRIWERVLSRQVVTGGQWIHVSVVLEATKIRLYLNGVLDCQRALAAQSIPVWASGTVELPFYFGRYPSALESSRTPATASAIRFLSRSLGLNAPAATELTTSAFKCFDGWLSHFRFHNRSLSPIHVRIVFDEKKIPSSSSPDAGSACSKVLELHTLLILLSSSSEGIVHFTCQFSKWLALVWGTFLGSNSPVVQQSALRVLRALIPLQNPLEASNVLLQNDETLPEKLGFYKLEDVFVHQLIRVIGFCLTKCPTNDLPDDDNDVVVVPWSLRAPRGVHANDFSSKTQDTDEQSELQNDVDIQYQSSKRQSLLIANELIQLLQRLLRCSNDAWRQSIVSVATTITSTNEEKDPEQQSSIVRFGKHALSFSALRSVESIGCVYFLGGGVEFLRPGINVEIRGSREVAQVLSLEYHTPSPHSQDPLDTPTDAKPTASTLAYVWIDNNMESGQLFSSGSVTPTSNWYDKVFGLKGGTCPVFSKINVDELTPTEASNPNWITSAPGIIYDLASEQRDVFSVIVEKANEVIPVVFNQQCTALGNLESERIGCFLLKILGQVAGNEAGVDQLWAKPGLIDGIAKLSTSQDENSKHETLHQVEKRVSALRREVYAALVELGSEGEFELARAFDSNCEERSISPISVDTPTSSFPGLNEDELVFSDVQGTTRRNHERSAVRMDELGLPDAEEGNANWEEESKLPAGGEDDMEDGELEDDEDEDEDGSLDDDDNDDEDDDDAETRAEFVEELMLMGFPEDWCVLALKQTENDIVGASAWIVDNLEYLSKLQSTLDKERDNGRNSPRFDEEEDDVVPLEDATQPPSLNSSNSFVQSSAWRENAEDIAKNDTQSGSEAATTVNPRLKDDHFTAPLLNDKEMGRKLFAEMYFPFEDGGYLSNTKTQFMRSWRTEAMEMKVRAAPSTPQPITETTESSRSPFEEDFQAELSQLDLRGLLVQLRKFESTLSVLYARQFMVTLLLQTTASTPRLTISYSQWFKLLKLVLLRGAQFTVISRTGKTLQLREFSVDEAFSRAFEGFASYDAENFIPDALEFCLTELESAATSKLLEAVLWTQRDLKRPDKTVAGEPGVEIVIWILNSLLVQSRSTSFSRSTGCIRTILRQLRCCLGTTNLPLKFVVIRTISRLLSALPNDDIVGVSKLLNESQLFVGEFLTAAILRHNREVNQGRLLFSQYLQGYIELLHLLHRLTGINDSAVTQNLTVGSSNQPSQSPICPKLDGSSLQFDRKRSRSSLLTFAEDDFSVSYSGNEVWKAACATVGFSTGVHSWTVRIEKSSSPYLFVGVATRHANLDSFLGADDQSWGFIGDKALYYQRNRVRAYGETFTEEDCIGLRLDCEKGELSFSKNGVDLGLAFDNIVGEVCPAVAFYSRNQKLSFAKDSCVSISGTTESSISPTGEDASASVEDCLIACEIMANWVANKPMRPAMSVAVSKMTHEWLAGSTKFVTTRSGKSLWVDITRETCGKLGFYSDDCVRTPRGNGAVVGAAAGRIWVEVENEPGAWFFHPSKLRLVTAPDKTTEEAQVSSLLLSQEEIVEFGEHVLWSIAVDRELLSVVNDFCEVSRTSPWNLTPIQLLSLVKEKTSVLELTAVVNVLALPQEKLEKMVIARFALLRYFNMYMSRSLPFFDLTWHYFLPNANSLPCRLISQCRGSLFVCVKNTIFTSLMERTANSPKRSDDEYDYPEDLPQLQVNRLKAAAAKCHEGTISSLFFSLFGQSFEELHFLPLKTQRMVYSHPMDDGQLRSFKVKFEGEGVDDYGGPYREFFSQFFAELQMLHVPEGENNANTSADSSVNGGPSSTSLKLDAGVPVSECVLPFLMPSPNWRNGVGANREKFVLNGAIVGSCAGYAGQPPATMRSSPGESAEEKRQLYCEMFHFFGQMIGVCLRTRVCVRLDLAMSVWKQLVGEDDSSLENALETLKEIDFVAYSLWKALRGILDDAKRLDNTGEGSKGGELAEQLEAMDLVFTTVLSDGRAVELCEDGANIAVTLANLEKYLDAMLRARVQETQAVMNIIKQGLHSIMPVSALALLTWNELEKRMCGVAEVDVKLLQANTEYDEELSASDEFIQRFWRVLESFESEDKRAFLRFVWARSRLPLGSAQFHQKFKIQALANGDGSSGATSTTTGEWMDSQMPKSHTCFFALQLPRYSNDDVCRARILYAVRNCVEMDGDFRLADTEMTGWTGISPTDQLRI